MSVLVTTTDGYHVFTSNGQDLHALAGHRVEALAPATNRCVARDHRSTRHLAARLPTASGHRSPSPTRISPRSSSAGRHGVRRHCRRPGAASVRRGCTRAPPCVRRRTGAGIVARGRCSARGAFHDCDVRRANAPRQRARRRHSPVGRLWPYLGTDDRRRRRRAPGARPSVATRDRRGSGVGRPVQERRLLVRPGSARPMAWNSPTRVASPSTATTCSSPSRTDRAPSARPCTAHRSTAGPWNASATACPKWLRGNVDTGCIASDGRRSALVDGDGNVWSTTHGLDTWERIASALAAASTGAAIV